MTKATDRQIAFLAARCREEISLEQYAQEHLERDGKSYICPCCLGSGDSFSLNESKGWNCFHGSCGQGGGLIELAKAVTGIENDLEIAAHLIEEYKLPYSVPGSSLNGFSETEQQRAERLKVAEQTRLDRAEQAAAIRTQKEEKAAQYIQASKKEPGAAYAYMESRGISRATCEKFGIGYVSKGYAGGSKPDYIYSEMCVIPTSYKGYTARNMGTVGERVIHGGIAHPLNIESAFTSNSNILFITEGEIDALSIIEAGYQACATCSAAYVNIFLTALDNIDREQPGLVESKTIAVIMDADNAGRKAASAIAAGIKSRFPSASVIIANGLKEGTDVNEAWTTDRENLVDLLKIAENIANGYYNVWEFGVWQEYQLEHEVEEEEAIQASNRGVRLVTPLQAALDIFNLVDAVEPVSTGFDNLNEKLSGGLMPQSLYVLNAASSLGKTTLMLQLADQIAASGKPVMFVTIEMRTDELVSKSLSRIVDKFEYEGRNTFPISAIEMRMPKERNKWSLGRLQALEKACNEYAQTIAPNLMFLEATSGRPTVETIREQAERMKSERGEAPIIFIDYLQLLAYPLDENGRQITDDRLGIEQNMTLLRQITAKDGLGTAVFTSSAISRGKDAAGGDGLSAGKGAGGIEFSADVVIGLEPEKEGKETIEEARTRARGSRNRTMLLTISKNRSGKTTGRNPAVFKYDAAINLWIEQDEESLQPRPKTI